MFVVCERDRVIALYTLSASGVSRKRARARFARGMPDPIPVLLLGQLGVDHRHQGRGFAAALVRDALIRALSVTDDAGVAGVYVDALTPALVPFYERLGFEPISAAESTALMIRMKDVRAALRDHSG